MEWRYLFSVALALALVYPIRSILDWYTIKVHGPDSNIVKHKVYKKSDGTCYSFKPVPYVCPLGASRI